MCFWLFLFLGLLVDPSPLLRAACRPIFQENRAACGPISCALGCFFSWGCLWTHLLFLGLLADPFSKKTGMLVDPFHVILAVSLGLLADPSPLLRAACRPS